MSLSEYYHLFYLNGIDFIYIFKKLHFNVHNLILKLHYKFQFQILGLYLNYTYKPIYSKDLSNFNLPNINCIKKRLQTILDNVRL